MCRGSVKAPCGRAADVRLAFDCRADPMLEFDGEEHAAAKLCRRLSQQRPTPVLMCVQVAQRFNKQPGAFFNMRVARDQLEVRTGCLYQQGDLHHSQAFRTVRGLRWHRSWSARYCAMPTDAACAVSVYPHLSLRSNRARRGLCHVPVCAINPCMYVQAVTAGGRGFRHLKPRNCICDSSWVFRCSAPSTPHHPQ